jgi:hypothetical protein
MKWVMSSLAVEQRVVGKPAARTHFRLCIGRPSRQRPDAFLGTEYAQAFFRLHCREPGWLALPSVIDSSCSG